MADMTPVEIEVLLARITGLTRHPYMGGAGAHMQEALYDAGTALRAQAATIADLTRALTDLIDAADCAAWATNVGTMDDAIGRARAATVAASEGEQTFRQRSMDAARQEIAAYRGGAADGFDSRDNDEMF